MVWSHLLALDAADVSFDRLGFAPCGEPVRQRLERVMEAFVEGYNTALRLRVPRRVAAALEYGHDPHHRGFAFEGAGMYYGLLDLVTPWRSQHLRDATRGALSGHDYIATVGAGFAVARLPWGVHRLPALVASLPPLVGWCVPDGYGFHQGLFHAERFVDQQQEPPTRFPAWAGRLFDSGVGRSLWWSRGADPERIAETLADFPRSRRSEMWCGLGVACAYACGVEDSTLARLAELAGGDRVHLASGVFFAARMRQKGRNPSPETERTSRAWLGVGADVAARLVRPLVARVERQLPAEDLRSSCYDRLRDSILLELIDDRGRVRDELLPPAPGSAVGPAPGSVPGRPGPDPGPEPRPGPVSSSPAPAAPADPAFRSRSPFLRTSSSHLRGDLREIRGPSPAPRGRPAD